MPKIIKTVRQSRKPKNENLQCMGVCGQLKKHTNFYQSTNPIHQTTGKIMICKDCIKKMCLDKKGNADIELTKKMLSHPLIDKPFLYELYKNCLSRDSDTIPNYFRQLNSMHQYKDLSWKDSQFEPSSNDETDDLIYSLEWAGNYTKSQLLYLDDYLKDLKKDFKIVTRNHLDYARKIAKASLAMDEAYEDMLHGNGSETKYKQMREAFDTLSKSAQFAESGRGANDVSLGNFGIVFDMVEKHTWVPKYQPTEQDIYDKILDQFSNINKSL